MKEGRKTVLLISFPFCRSFVLDKTQQNRSLTLKQHYPNTAWQVCETSGAWRCVLKIIPYPWYYIMAEVLSKGFWNVPCNPLGKPCVDWKWMSHIAFSTKFTIKLSYIKLKTKASYSLHAKPNVSISKFMQNMVACFLNTVKLFLFDKAPEIYCTSQGSAIWQ